MVSETKTAEEIPGESEGEGLSPSGFRLSRLGQFLLCDARGASFCALSFFLATIVIGYTFLHDEGLLTFDLARAFREEPLALFFFHKGKPPLLLLYAPAACIGLRAYLVLHGAVCALAIFLASRAASALDIKRPNIAGWALATSTSFAVAASNGMPNVDGAAFLTLFLFLYFTKRRIWAALVLGLLPMVRYELAPVALAFVAYDFLRNRDLFFLLFAASLPGLYFIAGAFYHWDVLWLTNVAVQPQEMPEELKSWQAPGFLAVLGFIGLSFLLNSPFLIIFAAVGVAVAVRAREEMTSEIRGRRCAAAARREERGVAGATQATSNEVRRGCSDVRNPEVVSSRALGARTGAFLMLAATSIFVYGALTVFQATHIQPVDLNPRTHTAALPLLALLAAVGASRLERALPVTVLLVISIIFQAALLAGPASKLEHLDQHHRIHELIDHLKDEGIYRGQPIFTDIYAVPKDPCAGIEEARLLANDSIIWELTRGTTDARGQRQAVLRAFSSTGALLDPDEHEVRRDSIYIIYDHPRSARWQEVVDREEPERHRVEGHIVSYWPADDA